MEWNNAWTRSGDVNPSFPFANAIKTLADFKTLCVPSDMLFTTVLGVRMINKLARHYASLRETPSFHPLVELGADSLFPLVVWVVLHVVSDTDGSWCWPSTLGHLDRFIFSPVAPSGFQSALYGEVGFTLTLLQAAVRHILELQPDQVQTAPAFPRIILPTLFDHLLGHDVL